MLPIFFSSSIYFVLFGSGFGSAYAPFSIQFQGTLILYTAHAELKQPPTENKKKETTNSSQMRIIAKVHATHSIALYARRLPFEP